MKDYKFGFCAWYTPFPGPFALTFAGEAGYDGVQISDLGGDEQAYPLKNRRLRRGFLDAAKEYNMEIQMVNLLVPGLSNMMKQPLNSPGGRRAIDNIRNGIEASQEMGVNAIFIPSVFGARVENEYDLDMSAAILREAGSIAKEHGVTLLYESFAGYDTTTRLYEKAGRCFRLCYDTLNPYKYGFGDAVKELRQYGPEMIHTIHIKDCAEDYQNAELIGKGVGKFYEIAEVIKDIGYTGWIVNENNYFKGELGGKGDPQKKIIKDLETLRDTFNK